MYVNIYKFNLRIYTNTVCRNAGEQKLTKEYNLQLELFLYKLWLLTVDN
jgi:hypothetical protein